MKSIKSFGTAFICGLIASQMIATIHLFFSNQRLIDRVTELNRIGFITIPSDVFVSQIGFTEAFYGGLFFTVSIGISITIVWIFAILLWRNLLTSRRYPAVLFVGCWGFLIVAVNYKTLLPVASSYLLIVPLLVTTVMFKMKSYDLQISRKKILIFFGALVFLSLAGYRQMSTDNATAFRDNYLLYHKAGQAIIRFYYDYTLFAAHAIKPLDQQVNKTVYLKDTHQLNSLKNIKKVLSANDYLMVDKVEIADLVLKTGKQQLDFYYKNSLIFTTSIDRFLSSPDIFLLEFSQVTDHQAFFRWLIKMSLIIAILSTVFFGTFLLIYWLSSFWSTTKSTFSVAIIATIAIIAMTLVVFSNSFRKELSAESIYSALRSPEVKQRISALKAITLQKLDLSYYPVYKTLIKSENVSERFWLARAASVSLEKENQLVLRTYINDDQTSIACQALRGVSLSNAFGLKDRLIRQLEYSDNWYVQLCTYHVLRDIGWKQNAPH